MNSNPYRQADADTAEFLVAGAKIVRLRETASTNDAARDPAYVHGDVVLADRQWAGRGQPGSVWESEPGRNLTFSVVLEPRFLDAGEQFLLSEAVSLGIADALGELGFAARVKWPNDILIGGRKTAGILIENDLRGTTLMRSVVGVGLNVNQTRFPATVPNATSPALSAGREFDRMDVLKRVYEGIIRYYGRLERGEYAALQAAYHRKLFRLGEPARYRSTADGEFTGVIRRVEPSGELHVEHPGGEVKPYLFREIEFLMP